MTKQHLKVGTTVIVEPYENLEDLRGVIVAGPKFQRGKSLFKVPHEDFENWYSADKIRPILKPV